MDRFYDVVEARDREGIGRELAMAGHLRVVSWNCKRAAADSGVWDYLLELSPGVVLLQEVGGLPERVLARFECYQRPAIGPTGRPQKFSTALLVRGRIGEAISLKGMAAWVDAELDRFEGNLICRELFPFEGPSLKAVAVYSPAWPIDPRHLAGVDTSDVRLSQYSVVWLADILWASLRHHNAAPSDYWLVAGDFNLSETFDKKRPTKRGNREFLGRMSGIGMVECLRQARGALTPTFRNTAGGAVKHQIDHMFVNEALSSRLISCGTGSQEQVFGRDLSDHLPLIADFSA